MFKSANTLFTGQLVNLIRSFSLGLLCVFFVAGCNSSKVPCPEIGGKPKFAMFHKKADPTKPNEEGFGQSKPMEYTKNGLMKKKSYKSLKYKPKR